MLRERRVERVAPVKEELPLKEIDARLFGAAKEAWLRKWCKYIDKLFHDFGVKEDPEAVLGIRDISDPEQVRNFLIEHYSDLTEPEALTKIKEMLRQRGYVQNVTDEMVDAMLDFWRSVKDRPEVTYALPHDIATEVEELRAHPELDSERAYRLVFDFLVREDVDRAEAERIAREIAESIPKIPKEERKVLYSQMIHVSKLAKQTALTLWMPREDAARKTVAEAREEFKRTSWLVELQDEIVRRAARMFEKMMDRRPTAKELDLIKEEAAMRTASVEKGRLSREAAFKMVDEYARAAVEYALKAVTPYEKVVEIIKYAPPPPRRLPLHLMPPGPEAVPIDAVELSGVKFMQAERTRDPDETLKLLMDYAKERGLKFSKELYLRVHRSRLPHVFAVYYPGRKPTKAYVDIDVEEVTFVGFDNDVVMYHIRMGTLYAAVYRKHL